MGRPSQVILGPLPLHGGDEALGEGPADDDVQLPVVDHDSVASVTEEGLDPGLDRLHDVLDEVLFDGAAVVVGPVANMDGLPHGWSLEFKLNTVNQICRNCCEMHKRSGSEVA